MTPFTWNADREKLSSTQFRSAFSGGWRNYIRRGYVWQPINSEIQSDLTITTFPGNVQFAANSQDWSDIVIDGTFSMKRHILEGNGHNAEPEFRMSLAVETQHNVEGRIDEARPAQVVYPGAWDSADLRLGIWQGRSARIEKVVDIHSMPSGDSEFVDYSFLVRSNQARVLAGPNFDVSPWAANGTAELNGASAFVARIDSELRGTVLRTPVAWYTDTNGETVITPVRVTFQILSDGETVRATKHIPRALIATALAAGSHLKTDATFTPDASPETSSVDGYTQRSVDSTWASLIAGAGTSANDSTSPMYCELYSGSTSGNWQTLNRPHLTYDTSSIGSGQVATAATHRLRTKSVAAGTELDSELINVYASTLASNTAVVTGDHLSVGTTPFATGIANSTIRSGGVGTFHTWTFNASGLAAVDVTGITKLAIAWETDRSAGSMPSPSLYATYGCRFESAEEFGIANDPLLTVVHSAASWFGAWYAAANPSGY